MRVVAAAVARHDLPEQRNLPHPAGGEGEAFGHDGVHRARAFVAAGLRDNAERAVHVAALLDRDEGRDLALHRTVRIRLGREVVFDRVLRTRFFADVDDRLAHRHARLPRRAEVVEMARHLVELLGSDDEIEIRQLLQQRRPAVLRHAAEDPEHEVRLTFLPLLQVAGLPDRLLLGRITHAAGVQQQDVAFVLVGNDAVTAGAQHRRDSLAVALVHLAAVGLDVDAVHWRRRALARRGGGGVNAVNLIPPAFGWEAGRAGPTKSAMSRLALFFALLAAAVAALPHPGSSRLEHKSPI